MDIKRLKQRIDKAKKEKAKAEGSIKTLKDRLKKEYNLDSFDEAKTHIDALGADISKIEGILNKLYKELKEKHEL